MPRKLSRMQRLLTSAGIAAVAAVAAPAGALAAECPTAATTTAFAQYGDNNQYFLAPGGSFDSLDQWSVRGQVSLLDSVSLLGLTGDANSLDLDLNEGVKSATFCVDSTMPHMRFTTKGTRGNLEVIVRTSYKGSTSGANDVKVSLLDHLTWSPSANIDLKTSEIPAGESGTTTVEFRSGGDWQVDDVYVDPYRR